MTLCPACGRTTIPSSVRGRLSLSPESQRRAHPCAAELAAVDDQLSCVDLGYELVHYREPDAVPGLLGIVAGAAIEDEAHSVLRAGVSSLVSSVVSHK